ncbi:prenyltransferase/squalene oxidase repeat-containing protein [Schlesneria paludicola]|uniref:prenyltransferase/squalene oxidase repeat-containing protein n=1 Tax=Schlesneria paludicola TaxID=360056 RepID=UPI00029A7152|nr:prenyltransferase/squalene oxidase repeat-containing protein [Schlesneria paludicola]
MIFHSVKHSRCSIFVPVFAFALQAMVSSNIVSAADEVLPKHVTPEALKAVRAGLDYLARTQADDGSWREGQGGQAYPVAMTSLACTSLLAHGDSPTRGRYAPQLDKGTEFLIKCRTNSGLITSPSQESGMPMHGHGFALMYLASVYGVLTKESMRTATHEAVVAGIQLTSGGQSGAGGWTYIPGSGDEGSVTVTQVQALRAAHNSGFLVPRGTIDEAVRYIERCSTPEGGIMYSLGSGGGPQLAISAAAVATLYNAGEYDAPVAKRCLDYVWGQFQGNDKWNKGGHAYYCQLYAAQAFYLSGDEYWDKYYPHVRDQLLAMQNKSDGSWDGDGIGKTYGTSIALIILQLPYRFLPVYQR